MFIEITNPHLVKQSKNYDLINKQYKINATLKWGIKNGGEIENWIIILNLLKNGINSIFIGIDGKLCVGYH